MAETTEADGSDGSTGEDARAGSAPGQRSALLRDALGVGLAVGAYGLSYGALAVSAGLTVAQTQLLSLLLYGGSTQLAMVGVLAGGGGAASATVTGALLGVRNLFYGISLRSVLRLRGRELLPAAHLLSDESAAMASGQPTQGAGRFAYWVTGSTVFLCWNLATLVGALAGSLVSDPQVLGLDTASSAAFLALVAPRLRERTHRLVFVLAGIVALTATPFVGAGLPVVLAGLTALSVLLVPRSPQAPAGGAGTPGTTEPGRTSEETA